MLWLLAHPDREMEVHYSTVIPPVSTAFRPFGPGSQPSPSASGQVAGGSGGLGRPLSALGLGGLLELADLTLEVGEVLEALVDRREPQVRDRGRAPAAARARPCRPGRSRPRRPSARSSSSTSATSCVDRRRVEPAVADRSMPARSLARSNGSVAPDALARRASGDLLDPLVGREPAAARQALAPAPDRDRLVGQARVDDLVVVRPAVGTAHETTVIRFDLRGGRLQARDLEPSSPRPHDVRASRTVIVWPGATVSVPSVVHHRVDDRAHDRDRARARRGDRPQRVAGLDDDGCTCGRRSGVARETRRAPPPHARPSARGPGRPARRGRAGVDRRRADRLRAGRGRC